MEGRRLTAREMKQGFVVCECGKFAHVLRPDILRKLPKGYHGELCPECNLFMCSVEKLREAGLMEDLDNDQGVTVEDIQEALHNALVDAGVLGKSLDPQTLALTNSIIQDVLTKYVPLTPRGKALTSLLAILKSMWTGEGEEFVKTLQEIDTTVLHFLHGWVADNEIGGGLGKIVGLEYMKRHGMIQGYETRFDGGMVGITVLPKMPSEFVKIDFVVDGKESE